MEIQSEKDKDHQVRLAIGNGVRTEVWREFLDRFGNIEVREFYASTEGNVGFVNYTGKIGAIGRVNFFHQVNTSSLASVHAQINQMKFLFFSRGIGSNLICQSTVSLQQFKMLETPSSSGFYEVMHLTNVTTNLFIFEIVFSGAALLFCLYVFSKNAALGIKYNNIFKC